MATLADLSDWMDENTAPNIVWYVKRLSGNDTLANGTHQAGPYIPKEFLFSIFPSMNRPEAENPDWRFELRIDSHGDVRIARAVWYNNRLRGGTRNEARVTNLGGSESALLDPESTGAVAVFAFHRAKQGNAQVCHVWVCDHETEADIVEDRVGPVEPGRFVFWTVDGREAESGATSTAAMASCWLTAETMPASWLNAFPTGDEIIRKAVELRSGRGLMVDQRLLKRRECEYQIFRSVENVIELPNILRGFSSFKDFIARAQTILQRRKSRSGRSLELQTRAIFLEEDLLEEQDFQHQPESEAG